MFEDLGDNLVGSDILPDGLERATDSMAEDIVGNGLYIFREYV